MIKLLQFTENSVDKHVTLKFPDNQNFLLTFRDIDFSLDGDFDKLSTFKVNMPDLHFSSPPKKSTISKGRTEGESSIGNGQGEKDGLDFMFDFNE